MNNNIENLTIKDKVLIRDNNSGILIGGIVLGRNTENEIIIEDETGKVMNFNEGMCSYIGPKNNYNPKCYYEIVT
jgi:phenylalanyl-tRNA synthetase beta subunit